jgi:hypothetical protein
MGEKALGTRRYCYQAEGPAEVEDYNIAEVFPLYLNPQVEISILSWAPIIRVILSPRR